MSTPAIPEDPEPVAVWDPRECPHRYSDHEAQQMSWWIATRLAGHADYSDRVEIYVLDGPLAVVRPWSGPPVVVPLADLPPAHLLTG